jgi:DNA-binding response OmpR family regulator
MDGWQVCERVREMSDVPILMLTAYGDQEYRIKGLQLGADDYLGKPFDLQELTLRIEAILRRTQGKAAGGDEVRTSRHYDDGHLFVDLERRIVQVEGTVISLTPHEFDLLSCFVRQPDKALSQEYLLRQVWGLERGRNGKGYVKTYVRLLRQKIEPDPTHPRYIITDWGLGYRLAGPRRKRAARG